MKKNELRAENVKHLRVWTWIIDRNKIIFQKTKFKLYFLSLSIFSTI